MFGGGDRTFNLGFVLATADRWLITGATAGVGLVTEFRALSIVGVQTFTLGVVSTAVIAALGVAYASR